MNAKQALENFLTKYGTEGIQAIEKKWDIETVSTLETRIEELEKALRTDAVKFDQLADDLAGDGYKLAPKSLNDHARDLRALLKKEG